MKVRDAMVHWDNLVVALPSDTVNNAMEKMVKHSVGSVIVTQIQNKAIGIITNQDIMIEILRSGCAGLETTLNKVMSTNLITIDESESLTQAIQKMEESRTHHLIVTINRGNVIGILSSFDIVRERSLELKSFS